MAGLDKVTAAALGIVGAGAAGAIYIVTRKKPTPPVPSKRSFPVPISVDVRLSEDIFTVSQRFKMLKDIGVDNIRVIINWKAVEPTEGAYDYAFLSRIKDVCNMIIEQDMSPSLLLRFAMAPPSWVPSDAYYVGETGETRGHVSLWYPKLYDWAEGFYTTVCYNLSGINFKSVTPTIAGGGGGEAVYPVTPNLFWMYDIYARQEYYKLLNSDVPLPKTVTGDKWRQTIDWYLSKKNQAVNWLIATTKYLWGDKVVLMFTDRLITSDDYQNAVATGNGNRAVREGGTLDYMIELANREGVQLDYTNVENTYADWVINYNIDKGNRLLWLEESQYFTNPKIISNKIIAHPEANLGFLWYDQNKLFIGTRPTSVYYALAQAINSIKA